MRKLLCCSAFLLASSFIAGTAGAAATKYVIANNTPRFVAAAQKVSDVDAGEVIDVTLWLQPHNRDALDSLVTRIYDKSSPHFRHFLKPAELARMVGPSEAEVKSVKSFAASHNLTVVLQDKFNFFVRVRGTADAVQKAFNVQLAHVSFHGRTYRTNLGDPAIADEAGKSISVIEGLDDVKFQHYNIAQKDVLPGGKSLATPATAKGPFSNVCFNAPASQSYTSSGSGPSATYTGTIYSKNAYGICGYTPGDIQTAYGLTSLYAQGLDGTGQTIVILDWCGSPTITSDANAFSARYGLPALTTSNFQIIDYPGQSSCASPDAEINIDVEWAHAIAPGANIILLVPPSASFADIDSGLLYIVENQLGNITSNSYGAEELYVSLSTLQLQNYINEAAAAVGISMGYSSGDSGDFTFDFGEPASVSTPADSPWAVAVGGISLATDAASNILWQTDWGTNLTLISEQGYVPDPALNFGFDFGSGGGSSGVFTKLSFQASVPGKYRKLPDISWLADPYTGGVIAITEPFNSPSLVYTVYGGTSLASPMFAGLWAIANQAAGYDLGFASPVLYGAPSSAITDILPVGSASNVTGIITNGSTKTRETAAMLAEPLEKSKTFQTAIWNYPDAPGESYVITFGTDSGLIAKPGWDDSTGLGVANPQGLISAVQAP